MSRMEKARPVAATQANIHPFLLPGRRAFSPRHIQNSVAWGSVLPDDVMIAPGASIVPGLVAINPDSQLTEWLMSLWVATPVKKGEEPPWNSASGSIAFKNDSATIMLVWVQILTCAAGSDIVTCKKKALPSEATFVAVPREEAWEHGVY